MLGIFGVQDLFASFWPPNVPTTTPWQAFAPFEDSTVPPRTLETLRCKRPRAVYASTDSTAPGRVVFVAINRTKSALVTTINGLALTGTASIYQITAASASGQMPVHPVLAGTQTASGTSLKITLPALSVTTIEVK